MARYYFHIERGSVVSLDETGLLLPSAAAACSEGAKAVADMVGDQVHSILPCSNAKVVIASEAKQSSL